MDKFKVFDPILNSTEESELPLSQLIPKIISQRGSFVDLSEEELWKEINTSIEDKFAGEVSDEANISKNIINSDDEDDESKINGDESKNENPQEIFFKNKEQAMNLVHSALNESSLSLDFISLLLSSVRPAAGTASMSPHLQQHVKVGSLSSDRVKPDIESGISDSKISRVGQGWKLESLERASNNLKNVSTRLANEVMKEKNYWNDLVKVLNSKEVLTKINLKNSKEIGVKYGFGDSGSNYYDKGIGLLKKDINTGSLYFEKLSSNNSNNQLVKPKFVKIRIYRKASATNPLLFSGSNSGSFSHSRNSFSHANGSSANDLILVDESSVPRNLVELNKDSENSISLQIKKARFYLFEEELFYQLQKEASGLIANQISIDSSNKIRVDLHHEIIEIDYITVEEENTRTEKAFSSVNNADKIGLFFRLMLSCEFRRNLFKKLKVPNSLSQPYNSNSSQSQNQDQQQNQMSFLRPLVSYYKHNRLIKQVEDMFETIEGVDTKNHKVFRFVNDPNSNSSGKVSDPFIRCSLPPLTKLEYETSNLKILVTLTSQLTSFSSIKLNLVKEKAQEKEQVLDVAFNDLRQLEDCLNWSIKFYSS